MIFLSVFWHQMGPRVAMKIRKLTKLLNTLLGINMSWDFLDGPVVKTLFHPWLGN